MKQMSLIVLVTLCVVMPGNAQQNSSLDIFVISGNVIPSSPMTFASYWTMHYGAGIGVGYPLSPSMTIQGMFEYYRFKLNEEGVREGFDTRYMRDIWIFKDVSLSSTADPSSVMTVSANLRLAPSERNGFLTPNLIAGVGLMRFALSEIALPTTSVLTVPGSEISMTAQRKITGGAMTALLVQAGAGLDFNLSDVLIPFLEARYVFGFTKGVNTSYIPLNAGVRIRF